MSLILSSSLVLLAEEEALPDGTPLIGWHNIVETDTVSTTTEEDDSPATNLANPSTNLVWQGTALDDEYVVVDTSGYPDEIDYVGIARHNFGTAGIAISLEAGATNTYQKILLHFDTDGNSPDVIIDSNVGGSAHTWTLAGNAFQDATEKQFGSASLRCDGSGDWATTADHADFSLGSGDWTISCWFNRNGGNGTLRTIGGQGDGTTNSNRSAAIQLSATNVVTGFACVGSTAFVVTGTTTITATGWHYVEFVRTGNTLKLFVDGTQEGGDVAITGTVNNSTTVYGVGVEGSFGTSSWNGWLDDYELLVGIAKHTEDFVVPGTASDGFYWTALSDETVVSNDAPIVIQFTPQVLQRVRLRLQAGTAVPEAAVLYVGKLLIMERGIRIENDHVPISYGRKAKVVNGFSESGNFLGRVVTQQHRESKAEYAHITPTWYRSHLDPFVAASKTEPFFYVWNPSEYPLETGFCWMINDPQPETNPVTRRIAIEFNMKGVT